MRILMAATELWPLAKVGGLGDMVASLAASLRKLGHDVRCALPAYAPVDAELPAGARVVARYEIEPPGAGVRVGIRRLEGDGLPAPALLVDHDRLRREGVYDDPATRRGYPDNGLRWALYCRAVHAFLGLDGWLPDVVHAHDHPTGPLLGLLRWAAPPAGLARRPATVFTLHNAGYQGIEPPTWTASSGLPAELGHPLGPLEFHGNVNLLKIGIMAADRLTTVSPRYAIEIRTTEEAGAGLRGLIEARADRLTGILNGIDTRVWDPSADPHLPFPYSAADLSGKGRNRSALREEVGLQPGAPGLPLLAMVTRLTGQKGLDILLPALDAILDGDAQMVVLGSGEARYEEALAEAAARHPGRLAVRLAFDEALAHRVEAGADVLLMPSRWEPCGLNQMYSLRYGTVPVVRAVGGLADTVIDVDQDPERGNGFVFTRYDPSELLGAVGRARVAFEQGGRWLRIMKRGMRSDFSWGRSARSYVQVYEKARADAGL